MFFFFFSSRRRHTRYIGDWSSDVCSSDLAAVREFGLKYRYASSRAGARTMAPMTRSSTPIADMPRVSRSEERRVGKECRSRWSAYHEKKKHRGTGYAGSIRRDVRAEALSS